MVLSRRQQRSFTVALDAMGGDHGPAEVVAGAVQAAREQGVEVLLVGDRAAVEPELASHACQGLGITVIASEGVIQETDHPVRAMRSKPRASVLEAVRLVKAGRAQAAVTMGSTGAAMASATLVLGLLEGLQRPALGGPLLGGLSSAVLVDLGSNVDCRPSQLLGFAAIGVAFARCIQGVESPRVALLTVGAEEGKGNRQVREAYRLFKSSGLNFVGNVEGLDLFLDKADVVVCDGFVGNVLMKFAEGLGMALARQFSGSLGRHLPPLALKEVGDNVAALTNAAELEGGGPLLGVDGVVVVGHGRARADSVAAAVRMARRAVDAGLVDAMRRELATLRQPVKE
ncbi:MAG: phosphate acyltransferase PlsX [Chloroflexi bacterium]|nr:phosphate acyltransferase PlsX [Chloroflexota bacterium]